MYIRSIKKTTEVFDDEWKRLANTDLGATMIKNSLRLDRTYGDEGEREMREWLRTNTSGLYYMTGWCERHYGDTIYFEKEEDAIVFKLVWL